MCTRVALFWISIHDNVRNPRHDLLDQTISKCGHSVMIILHTHKHTKSQDVWVRLLSLDVLVCVCVFYLHLLLGDAAGGSESNS